MKKIINDPARFVDESIDGILLAHPDDLRASHGNRRALVRSDAPRPGKVGIVTGGGAGHLPVFLGYVGQGLCDGVAVGNVFSSPSAEVIHAATTGVSGGAGVLYLYGNYGGDIYNFELAADLAGIDGIPTRTVLARDDVASAPVDKRDTRRGVAGMIYAFKIAGAAAERGDDLDRVTELAQRASDSVRTMGVGLSPTILPAAGEPTFVLEDGEMEVGIGIHGEPGIRRGPLTTADEVADVLLGAVLDDLSLPDGSRVSVLVNGMGATPLEELYVLYRRIHETLASRGIDVRLPFIGNYVTSLEMAGASVSVLVLDDELEELLDAPAFSPFFSHTPYFSHTPSFSHRPESTRGRAPRDASNQRGRDASGGESDPGHEPGAGAEPDAGGEPGTSHGPGAGDPRETASRPAAPTSLAKLLLEVLPRMHGHEDELRELDAALGDGDLGITVSLGSSAAVEAIERDPSAPDGVLLQRVGTAFAGANPSTFAALVGGGILYAAARLEADSLDSREAVVKFGRDVAARITERGGAALGDKTVLDVIVPSLDELESEPELDTSAAVARMTDVVADAIARTADQRSARGRAAWLQERSIGRRDPGMTAYLAFLTEVGDVLGQPGNGSSGS